LYRIDSPVEIDGRTFAGNLTILGSVAKLIVVESARVTAGRRSAFASI
jgi:hypothetical protein